MNGEWFSIVFSSEESVKDNEMHVFCDKNYLKFFTIPVSKLTYHFLSRNNLSSYVLHVHIRESEKLHVHLKL